MINKILMPALSPTMTQGKLAKWIKKDGDFVKSGDVLLEIETDKATMEVESVDDGFLKILVGEGADAVKVNTEIGILGDSLESLSSLDLNDNAQNNKANNNNEEKINIEESSAYSSSTSSPYAQYTEEQTQKLNNKSSSPLAKRMMQQNKISEEEVAGSGPMGRIIKDDIIALLNKRAEEIESFNNTNTSSWLAKELKQNPAEQKFVENKVENKKDQPKDQLQPKLINSNKTVAYDKIPSEKLVEASNLRKTIAERLTFAKQNIPHFYLSVDCNIDKLMKLRLEINEQFYDSKVSINDFIIKAASIALKNNLFYLKKQI